MKPLSGQAKMNQVDPILIQKGPLFIMLCLIYIYIILIYGKKRIALNFESKSTEARYLNHMSIQGTWADALIIQAIADALKVTIQIVESSQGFAPLTTVYPVQERNTSSTITVGHIDECHYVSTTALLSNASISMCNE